MLRARVAAILVVTGVLMGCDAVVKAVRDKAYAEARGMGGLDDTTLTVATNGATGYPARAPNPLAIRRLVVRHEYATLDSLFTAWADSTHRDFRNESYWFGLYDAMWFDTTLAEPLARWSRERPTSAPAYLARAEYLTSQAWAVRGTAYARSTPRKATERMNEMLAAAKACVDTALTLTPRSGEAYIALLTIVKSSGDTALSHQYLTKGLEDIPLSFSLRRQYLRNLVPRWGGSYAAMRAVVDAARPLVDSNPRLRALEGYIALDEAEVWELQRNEQEALAAYNRALTFGDESQFHLERGQMLLRTGHAREALPDLDFAVASAPGNAAGYLWRGMVREALWAADRSKHDLAVSALSDYQHAVVIDPTDYLGVGRFTHLYAIVH